MTPSGSIGLRQEAADRRLLAGFFRFAAGYFLKGPDDETEKVLADPEWCSAAVEADLVQASIMEMPLAKRPDQNEQFMTRFRIPGTSFVPPFEQAYRDGKATVEDAAVSECLGVYSAAGYQLDPFKHIQADHIGHQARFLAALLEREADCLEQQDESGAVTVTTWQSGFVDDHCSWWTDFAAKVKEDEPCRQILTVISLVVTLAARLAGRRDIG